MAYLISQNKYLTLLVVTLMLASLNANVYAESNPLDGGDYQDFDCLMEPNQKVNVGSPVEGIIESISVKRGDFIKKGQQIISLRSELENESVKLTKARFEFGKRSVKRNEELYQQKLISIHDKDELETDTKLAEMELGQAIVRLNLKTINSPITGYVIEQMKSAGEYVDSEPVLTLVSIDPLYVEVVAPKEYLGKIKRGMKATITPEKPINKNYKAVVTIIDPVVDAASGTFRIRLEMKNPKGKIPSGLKCGISF